MGCKLEAIIKSIKIVGMQAAVPPHRHSFVEDPGIFTQEEADKLYATTGIHSRRVLPPHLCASDMCLAAAESLLSSLSWDPSSVDVLIYVSQDPDYALPATACLLQARLGLPMTAACFDVGLGCSGFIYGSWMASQLLSGSNGKRALVLCADVSTRNLVDGDKGTLPLFGDAGVATAYEFDETWPDSYVVLGTDGTGGQHITVKKGARRHPHVPKPDGTTDTVSSQEYKDSRLYLNGAAVFSFTLKVVPKMVKQALALSNNSVDELDMVVMHQANAFILEHLRKKAKISEDKYLIDMAEFGNTSSASVPLAICHKLGDFFSDGPKKTMLGGFGVGWSWGALVTDLQLQVPAKIVTIEDDFEPLQLVQA